MAESIIRCSDGHLFTANWIPLVGIRSIRLGTKRYARCPVNRRWRLMERVSPGELSADQLAQAAAVHGKTL